MGDYDEALNYFHKLNTNLGHQQHPEIMYQIGNVYELMGDYSAALEWYHQLLGIVQTDAGVLRKVGEIYEAKSERQQAFHYHLESYRLYPCDFSVINWIGSHFIELQIAEKAITFFERAVLQNPNGELSRITGFWQISIISPTLRFVLFAARRWQLSENQCEQITPAVSANTRAISRES
jgi:intraflagellar transport protein 88